MEILVINILFLILFMVDIIGENVKKNRHIQEKRNTNQSQQPQFDTPTEVKWNSNQTTYLSSNSSDTKCFRLIKEAIELTKNNSLSFQNTIDYYELISSINSGRENSPVESHYFKTINEPLSCLDRWYLCVDVLFKLHGYYVNNIIKLSPSIQKEYLRGIAILTIGLRGFYKFNNPHNLTQFDREEMDKALVILHEGLLGLIAQGNLQRIFSSLL